MDKWVCELCGYVYDPARGAGEVAPGTPFEELPGDWVCPECLAEKDRFVVEYAAHQVMRGNPRG
ncbi:rubredoxin [Desulfallas thermosapovorans]|uniref:Rubredoxin n=1 Tax=Desulfallas thermosapovorans DSM 6562 TaxID=1121431 RepID=A0A5S4ZPY5_9FIRM|nr:rubredoxin [Desulfallas thermosapovorans]TYO94733.1 rubredoxin [Desulfallas thermosapovorans DSM 6562]